MKVAVITGSGGLIGAESVRYFSKQFDRIIGIDNDSRRYFFGNEASTMPSTQRLQIDVPPFVHEHVDIRDGDTVDCIFRKFNNDIRLVIHTAAQPSHDWAAREPLTDFSINATGTLNLLEATRRNSPDAVFIFTSTNKVYGDTPNRLPLVELESRWELDESHQFFERGIDESMCIDRSKHSLFGASKVAADVLVQEYGLYFGMHTAAFRGGCLTGPNHAGTELHGFLSYLVKCCVSGRRYTILGHKGKQVRDNIHSYDLITMFDEFYKQPRRGEVYNAGGGRFSNCSLVEAVRMSEELTGCEMNIEYCDEGRIGDHIWYISDTSRFRSHYPGWQQRFNIDDILRAIVAAEGHGAAI